jgi:membrane-associated phospholipid phosphatase
MRYPNAKHQYAMRTDQARPGRDKRSLERSPKRDRSALRLIAGVAATAAAVFIALTIVVTSSSSLALDAHAFDIANHLRAPRLDHAARILTSLGLIAIVGPVLVLGAALLIKRGHNARAVPLLAGGALTWITVWITKWAVDRARPPAPLVHTTGHSYPSAHAANSVGWLALAIALTALIPTRAGRITAVATGALLTMLIGLTRIYLRAHYPTDVLAGQALAIAMYALAMIGALTWQRRRYTARKAITSSPPSIPSVTRHEPGNPRDQVIPPR